MKSNITKGRMSISRKKWITNNPGKFVLGVNKMAQTKREQLKWKGKNNPNYGSHKFMGTSYQGPSWNKGLTKENNKVLKRLSIINLNNKNPNWKGDEVNRVSLHQWIRKYKDKPKLCENCKQVEPYDLANISQQYKRDINDFEWLCRRCHMIKDGRLNMLKYRRGVKENERKRIS